MNVTELVIVLTGTDDFAHCVWFSRFPNTGHWDNRDQFWESFSFHFSGSGDARDVWQESAGKLTINSKSTFHWLNILLNWVLAFYPPSGALQRVVQQLGAFLDPGVFCGTGADTVDICWPPELDVLNHTTLSAGWHCLPVVRNDILQWHLLSVSRGPQP